MVRHHKLFWGSSYDRVATREDLADIMFDIVGRRMYNKDYERFLLYLVSKKIQRLSKSKTLKKCLLLSPLQVRMEQDFNGLLEGQENVKGSKTTYARKPCGCKRRKEWTLEGWTQSGQVWLHFNSFTNASKLRWGWICKGTPISNGKENRKIFKTRGGRSSC